MVGGIVIEASECHTRSEAVYINCQDQRHRKDTCGIMVEKNENSLRVELGDSVWWQGNFAYWTPASNAKRDESELKCGVDFDIKIPRIGFSGVEHPDRRPPEDIED